MDYDLTVLNASRLSQFLKILKLSEDWGYYKKFIRVNYVLKILPVFFLSANYVSVNFLELHTKIYNSFMLQILMQIPLVLLSFFKVQKYLMFLLQKKQKSFFFVVYIY